MIPEKIGIKIWDLKAEARDELYVMIDKHCKTMPRNPDGSIKSKDPSYNDNDIDSLRHSYVSAVYVIEFGHETAELLGRLNEYLNPTPNDPRKYKGPKSIKRLPKSFVFKIKENKTGANIEFFDVRNKRMMTKELFIEAIRGGHYPGYAVRKHQSGEVPYSTRDKFSFNNLG